MQLAVKGAVSPLQRREICAIRVQGTSTRYLVQVPVPVQSGGSVEAARDAVDGSGIDILVLEAAGLPRVFFTTKIRLSINLQSCKIPEAHCFLTDL